MKNSPSRSRTQRPLLGSVALLLGLGLASSFAQGGGPLYWVGTSANAGVSGSGTWNNFSTQWSTTPAGTANSTWNSDIANFNGTAGGTATIAGTAITANAINFNPGAGAFTILLTGAQFALTKESNVAFFQSSLTINGAGITNTSGQTQTITAGTTGAGLVAVSTPFTQFFNNSVAGNVVINNVGDGTHTDFRGTSSADHAVITNSGAASYVYFGAVLMDAPTAASATIINAGDGSYLELANGASGGLARVVNKHPNSFVNISELSGLGTTLGSIEGGGAVFLGAKNLTVGGNHLSTVFSGVIQDGFPNFAQAGTSQQQSFLGGSLTKVGAGTLILTGANTYTGSTAVNGGSLIVDGSLASPNTTVNPGGLLGGHGFIGGSVVNGGTVSPGNSPGTLTIKGHYTQSAGGTLRIEVAGLAPGEHDLLAIHGSASLAGTVRVVRLGGFNLHVGDEIPFLTAKGGVQGTFGSEQNDFASTGTIVKGEIVYQPNAVLLRAVQGSFAEAARTLCDDPNHIAVGKALDKTVGHAGASPLINFLNDQSLDKLCRDFELIAPDELTSIYNLGVSLANVQTANLERRTADIRDGSSGFSAGGYAMSGSAASSSGTLGVAGPAGKGGKELVAPADQRLGFFVTGVGEFTKLGDTDNARGYDLTTGGFTLGVDYRLTPNFALGLMAGYARTGIDLSRNGRITVDGGRLGVYATYFTGGFYADAAVTGGLNGYETRRSALRGTARGSENGGELNALIAAGYDWKSGALTVGPTASFQYTHVGIGGFTEHGSLAPLTYGSQRAESLRSAVGAKASYDWHVGSVVIKPEVRASWQHEYADSGFAFNARFAQRGGGTFTVDGPEKDRDSLLAGAGVAVLWNERTSTYVYYDGEFARSNYDSHNVSGGVRLSF